MANEPQLVVSKGENNITRTFQIVDEGGEPRDLTTVNGSGGQVRLYINDKWTKTELVNTVLTAVDLTLGKVKWVPATAAVPAIGTHDGQLVIENVAATYKEVYARFPAIVNDSPLNTKADRSFESWP